MADGIREICFTKIVSSRFQVERCRFSPDGKLLAACFGDYSVRVFKIIEAKENNAASPSPSALEIAPGCSFRQHQSNVWCIDFSQDGSLLCSCSSDKTVKVWDLHTHQLKATFGMHLDTVWCCSFAKRNKYTAIASGSGDRTVKIWNFESGEVLHTLTGYLDAVESLDFSSDGQYICTGSRDGTIKLWTDLWSTGNDPACLLLHATDVCIRFCTFSNHSDLLAAGGSDNAILVWSTKKDGLQSDLEKSRKKSCHQIVHPMDVESLQSCSKDGVSAATTESSSVGVAPKLRLLGHRNIVWNCSFVKILKESTNHSEELLISCSGDRTLRYIHSYYYYYNHSVLYVCEESHSKDSCILSSQNVGSEEWTLFEGSPPVWRD